MKKSVIVVTLLTSVLLLGTANGWACQVLGPNKHVGQLTKVDKLASTFTILDAEMGTPITFVAANQDMIKLVSKAKGQVIVGFEEKDGKLNAVDVHF